MPMETGRKLNVKSYERSICVLCQGELFYKIVERQNNVFWKVQNYDARRMSRQEKRQQTES